MSTTLTGFERTVCRAIAEAMYPPCGSKWPSFDEAHVIEEIDAFLQGLVPQKRRLIRLLLTFTQMAPLLRPPFKLFSRLSPAQRLGVLDAWDKGRSSFLNLCSTSLRMLFNLAYLSDEKVKIRIGEVERDECGKPSAPRTVRKGLTGRYEGILEFGETCGRSIREQADFLVIGSGPGGAVVAHDLAAAGHSVIVLEEGPFYRPEEHPAHAMRTLKNIYAEQGLRFTKGSTPVRTLQARALGGTSVVNSAICWRAPERVFEFWRNEFGIENLSREALDPYYGRAEAAIHVHPTEESNWGRKGIHFRNGCFGMGVGAAPTDRATIDCRGCSQCFYGCRNNAKQSMDRTYIPLAIDHGARFYTSCRAEQLILENGRIAGAQASILDSQHKARAGSVVVRAKATILAAGALGSPLLLLKSRLSPISPAVGRNLAFHNGYAVAGVFEDEVNAWHGATQDWHSEAYLPEIHMEVLWVNSALLTARTRGFGLSFQQTLEELSHTAFWCISICGSTRGRVTANGGWEPTLGFDLNQEDARLLKHGADMLTEHFLEAGARTVRTGLGRFSEIRSKSQLDGLKNYIPRPNEMVVGGNHLFGTCAMGADAHTSVVDSGHAVHGLKDLYVCDTSVFPSQSEVNPQLTLMAMAGRLATQLNARY